MRILDKKQWPYQIARREGTEEKYFEILNWCEDTVGPRRKFWFDFVVGNNRVYAFVDGEIATAFKLRWGNHVNDKIN